MAAYIARGQSIPDDQFSCPSNASGTDFVTIPWSNMSVGISYPGTDRSREGYYNGYCGIKGPHPRMEFCCKYGQLQPVPAPNATIALAQSDHCSQWCPFFLSDIDLWLYCLTQEGDTASNAFCRSDDGTHLETSGSLPRDGPFDPNNQFIKDKKKNFSNYKSAGTTTKATSSLVWIGLATALVSSLGSNLI